MNLPPATIRRADTTADLDVRAVAQAVRDHPSVLGLTGPISTHSRVRISVAIKDGHPVGEVAEELRKLVMLVVGSVPITVDVTAA